jgi:signal transduction histidine kinase
MLRLFRWFTQRGGLSQSGLDSDTTRVPWLSTDATRAPIEAIVIRCFGVAWLVSILAGTVVTRPHPGLQGRGVVILLAVIALVAATIATQPQDARLPVRRRVLALVGVTAAAAVLAVLQPNGTWQNGPLLVGIIAAMRLERLAGVLTLAFSVAVLMTVSAIENRWGEALSVLFTAVPWFLVMRLMREIATQRNALSASRAAEARAAAAAERGRLAREMHDVLAHSLSALALQLESTRLLAASRDVDLEVTRAIDQAHQLAASGLQEARRAIATARGDELPGPDRIGVLAEAFGQQSGLPVAVEVLGEPRELAPDARLAVYRTAQEALTNVRRHATAERVKIELAYLPQSTVLVVADHARAGTPPPAPLELAGNGYGLTGMRERAELLGGELLAQPTDNGFRVELRLPT